MSTPLNFKQQRSGGVYGTHPSSGLNNSTSHSSSASNTTRRRASNNPSEYGPFSSPHASFDDPLSFPPYAELPFTALKRRKQLQSGNSFVKWAMRGVLLSPVIALVLWSIAVTVFMHPQHGARSSTNTRQQQQTRRGIKRMLPNFMGSTNNGSQQQQLVQSPVVYMQQGQLQQQDQNGMMMVVTPQRQQAQSQEGNGRMMVVTPQRQQAQLQQDQNGMMMVVTPQRQQAQLQQDQNGMMMVVTPQRQQSQATAQAVDHQFMAVQHRQGKHIPVIAPLGSTMDQSQTGYDTSSQGVVTGLSNIVSQQQQPDPALQATMADATASGTVSAAPPIVSSSAGDLLLQPQQAVDTTASGNDLPAAAMQQQLSDPSATVTEQQASPVKQAIYYYDPNDTILSKHGDILQLPKVVYDTNGKAIPLSELRHAPIYVQPPMMGAAVNSDSSSVTVTDILSTASAANNLDMEVAPAREAATLPKWGTSTSQDQTIIIATVAVMALLVGALSARRLRSKSFLSSCIENETLEDDMAFDSAYTTTAGIGGADSSYNTFGGWKGDLEKFDV